MPKLDSLTNQTCDDDPYHQIPKWNKNHHFWMKHTPEGSTAFENDACPNCGFQVDDRSLVNCPECKSDLPRPTVEFVGWKCKKCGEKNRKSKLVCQCGAAYSWKEIHETTTPYPRIQDKLSPLDMGQAIEHHHHEQRCYFQRYERPSGPEQSPICEGNSDAVNTTKSSCSIV